jgi:hypothetical protein
MRTSWFDENAQHPSIHEKVENLKSFTDAMADGVIEKKELDAQEQRLVAAMKALEPSLSDDQHAKATAMMIELSAYNVMRLLHELHAERARMVFGKQ